MENVRSETKRLALCAILLALGLILKSFTVQVAIGGVSAMDVWLGGPFINFTAILFGPVYGAITGALGDVLGYFLKGTGIYMFPFTITATLKGLSIGLLWMTVREAQTKSFKKIYYISFAAILIFGLFNLIISAFFQDSAYYEFFRYASASEKSFNKLMIFLSVCLTVLGIFGLMAAAIQPFIMKLTNAGLDVYLKIFIAICVPSLVFTTANTGVLCMYYETLRSQSFALILIPRLIEEIIMIVYNSCLILLFMSIVPRNYLARSKIK